MKRILGILATGCLALGAANTASAIPLDISIGGIGGYASGEWTLSGPSNHSESWEGAIIGGYTWHLNIDPGTYIWEITGTGYFGWVGWTLDLAGIEIHSGSDLGGWAFEVGDTHDFDTNPVGVPEPGTLGLLGLALLGIGFANSRRRVGRSPVVQV